MKCLYEWKFPDALSLTILTILTKEEGSLVHLGHRATLIRLLRNLLKVAECETFLIELIHGIVDHVREDVFEWKALGILLIVLLLRN